MSANINHPCHGHMKSDTLYRAAGSTLNYFEETRTNLEYLSSGENLAGCADLVTAPSRTFLRVYTRFPSLLRVYMRCIFDKMGNVFEAAMNKENCGENDWPNYDLRKWRPNKIGSFSREVGHIWTRKG